MRIFAVSLLIILSSSHIAHIASYLGNISSVSHIGM